MEPIEQTSIGFIARIRRSFFTGIVFIAPLIITAYIIMAVIRFMDNLIKPLIPPQYHPTALIGIDIPGVGLVLFVVTVTFIGAITRGFVGRQISHSLYELVNRFPIVRSIYNLVKQILETVFNEDKPNFEQVCLVEYPRKGIYAIGFIAKSASGSLAQAIDEEVYAVFIPTTPNPTSGFFLYFPKTDVKLLDISVEAAAKLVISSGLVEPE